MMAFMVLDNQPCMNTALFLDKRPIPVTMVLTVTKITKVTPKQANKTNTPHISCLYLQFFYLSFHIFHEVAMGVRRLVCQFRTSQAGQECKLI